MPSRGAAAGFTLPQRSQFSVSGGSIRAPVSNSQYEENLVSKPSRWYVGLSRSVQPETLVPHVVLYMGHCESPGSRLSDSTLPNGALDPPRYTPPRCKIWLGRGFQGSCVNWYRVLSGVKKGFASRCLCLLITVLV